MAQPIEEKVSESERAIRVGQLATEWLKLVKDRGGQIAFDGYIVERLVLAERRAEQADTVLGDAKSRIAEVASQTPNAYEIAAAAEVRQSPTTRNWGVFGEQRTGHTHSDYAIGRDGSNAKITGFKHEAVAVPCTTAHQGSPCVRCGLTYVEAEDGLQRLAQKEAEEREGGIINDALVRRIAELERELAEAERRVGLAQSIIMNEGARADAVTAKLAKMVATLYKHRDAFPTNDQELVTQTDRIARGALNNAINDLREVVPEAFTDTRPISDSYGGEE